MGGYYLRDGLFVRKVQCRSWSNGDSYLYGNHNSGSDNQPTNGLHQSDYSGQICEVRHIDKR